MITSLLKTWFGHFNKEELQKYLFLGAINCCITGAYWSLYSVKDAIFMQLIVGYGVKVNSISIAGTKIATLLYLIPVIALYTFLSRYIQKNHLFYLVTLFYGTMLLCWVFIFSHHLYGLAHSVPSPWHIRGWVWAASIESFSALIFPVFWAFVTDISTAASARKGFGIVVMFGHLGGLFLPLFADRIARLFQMTNIFIILFSFMLLLLAVLTFKIFVLWMPKVLTNQSEKEVAQPRMPFFEGLRLLMTNGYLLGIFAIVGFFQIIHTIIDFNFNCLVASCYHCAETARQLYCLNGFLVNLITVVSLMLGINNIQRWLGLSAALLFVPLILGFALIMLVTYPELNVIFYALITAKVLNFALNSPSIKQLYIPTSAEVKYKSQVWIESFSPNGAKTIASLLNMSKGFLSAPAYLSFIFYFGLGITIVWILIVRSLARIRDRALEQKKIVC